MQLSPSSVPPDSNFLAFLAPTSASQSSGGVTLDAGAASSQGAPDFAALVATLTGPTVPPASPAPVAESAIRPAPPEFTTGSFSDFAGGVGSDALVADSIVPAIDRLPSPRSATSEIETAFDGPASALPPTARPIKP